MHADLIASITGSGSIALFVVVTDAAREWIDSNLLIEEWQWTGDDSFAVDSRYAEEIYEQALAEGLEVEI